MLMLFKREILWSEQGLPTSKKVTLKVRVDFLLLKKVIEKI